jgi:hypothetical protein
MRFKSALLLMLLLTPHLIVGEVHPLGIVIRPNVFLKVIDFLNAKKGKGEIVSFKDCIDHHSILVEFIADWDPPRPPYSRPDQAHIQASFSNLTAHLVYGPGCGNESKDSSQPTMTNIPEAFEASLEISTGNFGFDFEPQSMTFRIDRGLVPELSKHMKLQIKDAERISQFANSSGLKEGLLNLILDAALSNISAWLKKKLRGLTFLQSAGEVLKENPYWKEGPLLEKEAIRIDLVERSPTQKFLTFAFNPFRSSSAFSSSNGIELYFNAMFLNSARLTELTGLTPTEANSSAVLLGAKERLSDPINWSEASFTRPQLAASAADLSLVIPTSLTNEAWATFYRERLLKMRATIDVGKQTVGLLADQKLDVQSIITINPLSAPRMLFEANKFTLEVEDYILDFGNWIEDRLIPSTQLKSKVRIAASLKVDPEHRIIKMALDPNKFDLELRDLKGRLNPNETLVFQNIATTIWKDFFRSYAEFEIFPTLIDTENLPLEIQNVSVSGDAVVLDLNVLLNGVKK